MSQQGTDLIGRTLGRTYQIERLLGGGGMGAVYAARHVRTGGLFAVKILHRETAADTDIYKRFQDEARTVSALRHPHIVQVTDFDRDDDGTPFIVMELLEGEDLYQRLCRVGKLSIEQVLDIGRQVGSALHAAHEKGVIHRDIKPQNIFLVRHEVADQVTEVAKVVDFGISKIRRTGQQMTRDMTILGTPQFMSPEAALGQNSQLDGRADQWSLAVIMYLSLTGRLPFDGDNLVGVLYMVVHEQPVRIKQLAPEVPDTLVLAIERAMAKKKEDRYPRMVDFVRGMSGLGVTSGASIRLSPVAQPGAVIRQTPPEIANRPALAPQAPQLAADAPTAVPHLGTTPAPPRAPTPPSQPTQLQSEAPTKAAHMAGATDLPATRLVVAPAGPDVTPITVPAGQTPEMVATPTSPTAFSPLSGIPAASPTRPPPASGNTPTNIALTEVELQSLMSGSASTPDPREPLEDLQGAPTRVALMPQPESPTVARYEVGTNATVPLTVMSRPQALDQAFDAAYPNTLSHATGQEVSLKPRLLPQWSTVRETALRLIGVVPRSSVRLAVTGGVLTLLLILTVFWLASGGPTSQPSDSKGRVAAAGSATSGLPTDGLAPDGGSGTGAASGSAPGKDSKDSKDGKDAKGAHGAASGPASPTPPSDDKGGKGGKGKATGRKGASKAGADAKKRA
jgi:serine/threonine-protein kinase